jgi:hypothetical protein
MYNVIRLQMFRCAIENQFAAVLMIQFDFITGARMPAFMHSVVAGTGSARENLYVTYLQWQTAPFCCTHTQQLNSSFVFALRQLQGAYRYLADRAQIQLISCGKKRTLTFLCGTGLGYRNSNSKLPTISNHATMQPELKLTG